MSIGFSFEGIIGARDVLGANIWFQGRHSGSDRVKGVFGGISGVSEDFQRVSKVL